jgi:hypothetical protein
VAAVATLPLLLLLFLPLLFGVYTLYSQARVAPDPAFGGFRHAYMAPAAIVLRAVAYLLVWAVGGIALLHVTRRGNPHAAAVFAAPAGIVYVLTVTFASIDWVAALEPEWYSTIFGLYIIVGQVLAALAAAMVLLPAPSPAQDATAQNDQGNLLLTFVVLHAYLAFAQFFIIWNGNLPHEISWYVPRMHGGWGAVSVVLILVQFAMPFFALLFRAFKRDLRLLRGMAAAILVAGALETLWMVLPAARGASWTAVLCSLLVLAGLGGFWLALFGWQYQRTAVSPPLPAVAEGAA